MAAAIGAGNKSVVAEWENAVSVPIGMRKRRLIELLGGKRWKVLREAFTAGEGMPQRWKQAVRWYRRASRSIGNRLTVGEVVVLATLNETRALTKIDELRHHYSGRDGGWQGNASNPMPAGGTVRLTEDAAYGLRWIELLNGITLDPRRSLVGKLP